MIRCYSSQPPHTIATIHPQSTFYTLSCQALAVLHHVTATYLSLSLVSFTGTEANEQMYRVQGHLQSPATTKPIFISNRVSSLLDMQVKRQPSRSSVSDADPDEICLFYVRKGCSFKGP